MAAVRHGRRRWVFAPRSAARDAGRPIATGRHNRAVRAMLKNCAGEHRHLVIVPGFTSLRATEPIQITRTTKRRLNLAVRTLQELGAQAILVTGGNVHPDGTPFNEALGMKRALVKDHGIRPPHIVLEPYARHSTTNLRNAGRFMLTHDIHDAVVVSTVGQSFYFGRDGISGFRKRCLEELRYEVGELVALSFTRTLFRPSEEVFRLGDDPLDP